jgi:hypothetical protein
MIRIRIIGILRIIIIIIRSTNNNNCYYNDNNNDNNNNSNKHDNHAYASQIEEFSTSKSPKWYSLTAAF